MRKLLLSISVACLLVPTGALAQSAGLSSYTRMVLSPSDRKLLTNLRTANPHRSTSRSEA
jgi:hypothetical protein